MKYYKDNTKFLKVLYIDPVQLEYKPLPPVEQIEIFDEALPSDTILDQVDSSPAGYLIAAYLWSKDFTDEISIEASVDRSVPMRITPFVWNQVKSKWNRLQHPRPPLGA